MALSLAWPLVNGRQDWARSMQFYGYCDMPRDHKKADADRGFRDWAAKHRLACIEGERMVALDPRAFNPKDSLDRERYSFLARYFRPRDPIVLQRDLEQAFGVRSVYIRSAILSYWVAQGVISETGGQVQADRELLRLMGFTYVELMQALDGVVKKSYLQEIPNGHRLVDPALCTEYTHYLVNFDIMKERFFDNAFFLQQAGQPLPLADLGRVMGMDDMDDLRKVLREAKRRFDLNLEVSEDHVMFGPPSESSVRGLVDRERKTKARLQETEGQLRGRLKTLTELLDRYSSRETKLLNEVETFKEEGRILYIKGKVLAAVQAKIDASEGKGSR